MTSETPAQPPAAPESDVRTPREALADLIWHNTDEPMWSAMVLAEQFMTSDWLAAHDAATADRVRRETAEAQRCGGCKGQGSHRRHCPRHPSYHPWIPLADRAESIGDSIGDPALANRAWALAGAIRDEMPNHPYRTTEAR